MATLSTLSKEMKHRDREMVPKVLVIAMFALMLAALVMVATARMTGRPVSSVVPHSAITSEMSITLDGSRTAGVAVLNSEGDVIAHSTENKAGFIDVIWQSVMRERTVQGVANDAPLRLVRRENGHVAVIDDITGWKIELIGYGQDNVAAFARLID